MVFPGLTQYLVREQGIFLSLQSRFNLFLTLSYDIVESLSYIRHRLQINGGLQIPLTIGVFELVGIKAKRKRISKRVHEFQVHEFSTLQQSQLFQFDLLLGTTQSNNFCSKRRRISEAYFRTLSKIYCQVFFVKIVGSFQSLTIFTKELHYGYFRRS